jgi:hypothetical protein
MPIDNLPEPGQNPKRKRSIIVKKGTSLKGPDWQHKLVTALPLVLVNIVAIYGQFARARENINEWGLIGQIIFAAALESVAIAIAYHAYLAELSNDTALKLKLASYAFGIGVGVLNYSHFSNNFHPTAPALVVGIMSSASPFLWGMYSRRVSRNSLKNNGLIEDHAVRLGSSRWLYHPIRCIIVMSRSTWVGEKYAHKAIASYNESIEEKRLAKEVDSALENVSQEREES